MSFSKKSQLGLFALVVFFSAALAQLSSYLILTHMQLGQSIVVMPFLWLTYVQNHGGIFGTYQGRGWIFAIMTVIILTGLIIYLIKAKSLRLYNYICFGLIVGGGLSNILDRMFYGAVIDFIDVRNIPYWKYIFNTADTFIHLGIWPMLLLSLKELSKESPPDPNEKISSE